MYTCIDRRKQRIKRRDKPFKEKKLNHTGKSSPASLNIYIQTCIKTAKSVQVEKTLTSPFTPPISLHILTPRFYKKCSVT